MMELMISFSIGIFTILFAMYLSRWILKQDAGNQKMQEISSYIREGSQAYLNRQYKTIAIFSIIFAAIFFLIFNNIIVPLVFLFGALLSSAAGFAGMNIATLANVRVTNSAKAGLREALSTAFAGGSVMGLFVVGFGILGISLILYFLNDPNLIVPFGFGASFVALFARLGGGIYTKAADVGADLVGKVEKGIPEDDPRNPAVIADNVGDNVGDVAGMGADLFESFVASIIAAMIIAIPLGPEYVILPLLFSAAGALAMSIGITMARRESNPTRAMNNGFLFSAIIGSILFLLITIFMGIDIKYFIAALIGLIVMVLIGRITNYYTSYDYNPTKEIAKSSTTGPATNILAGISGGFMSVALPVIIIGFAIFISYQLGGLYGVSIAAVGMLSLAGVAIAIDSTGAISDNAGGIAVMSGLPKKVREVTDELDSAGNTAAAIAKGAAIGSAALTALALFGAYFHATGLESIDVSRPVVMLGVLIGSMLPFVFSALAIGAVGRAAYKMVEEVRRQFREIKGLMEGKAKPEYGRAVDISTEAALREMTLPALLVVLVPLIVGFTLGAEAVGGLLAGATVSGFVLALFLTNAGAMWDNAKKYIETGEYGGKGSEAHKAAVIGDTVGDPCKDTAGPSINILIKLMSTVSLLFASMFLMYSIL